MSKLSDEWQTPEWLFKELDEEFHFNIDLCAHELNSKCSDFCLDYLEDLAYCSSTRYEYRFDMVIIDREYTCFMNPPYSNPKPFIEKAWEDSKYCKIVCLLPNTIKTCKYLDVLDANNGTTTFRKWRSGIEIRDLTRRTGFTHPEKLSTSPSFGCMVLLLDRRGLS